MLAALERHNRNDVIALLLLLFSSRRMNACAGPLYCLYSVADLVQRGLLATPGERSEKQKELSTLAIFERHSMAHRFTDSCDVHCAEHVFSEFSSILRGI